MSSSSVRKVISKSYHQVIFNSLIPGYSSFIPRPESIVMVEFIRRFSVSFRIKEIYDIRKTVSRRVPLLSSRDIESENSLATFLASSSSDSTSEG